MTGPKRHGTGHALVKTMSAVELEEAEKLSADEILEVCRADVSLWRTAADTAMSPAISPAWPAIRKRTMQVIKRTVNNNNEIQIFECLLTFNKHILKTNFFQPTKVGLKSGHVQGQQWLTS